ncbi:MAG: Crp/Fnr family transcriptional regulator [Oscillibacter sp.]|jgi:CRP/FNR family transcriptional regulator|nr:Crp/Fnr family transcriptional regulator [Oscillibacter sp.]MCI9001634.1 Crp/Fnr family transcriptional regulator [Oscillibacter sp.]
MEFTSCFPVWDVLTPSQQRRLSAAVQERNIPKGTVIHRGSLDCTGLLLVRSGQLRAYILSDEGREITIYRLIEMDACLFSASCVMRNVQFDVSVEAEKETRVWVIPSDLYQALSEESAAVANYTNALMSSRFSEVMWLMEQIMWKSFDRRLADFLLRESALEGTDTLSITHERIANHLGSAREVVTRMLRYFQDGGLVKLSRGCVELSDPKGLRTLCEG